MKRKTPVRKTRFCATGCGRVATTKDHIIPKWAFKKMDILIPQEKRNYYKKKPRTQRMCNKCNVSKGGHINIHHELELEFWLDVREHIGNRINDTLLK